MSKALRDKLPKGSSRNKIEALADIVDLMPKGNFKPVSMVLEPKRFDTYRGMRKDFFRLVVDDSLKSGPFEHTENYGVSLYQFTKAYEVDLQSWDEPEGLPTVNFPEMPDVMMPDVIAFQVNVTFDLLIKNLTGEFSDIEKLKGLRLELYLNDSEEYDSQNAGIGSIPVTLIKNKYGGIMISGSAHSAFTLDKPFKGNSSNELYLSCYLNWAETDFSFADYSNYLMWKENAFELTSSIQQMGVRVSILDVHTEAPMRFRPSEPR